MVRLAQLVRASDCGSEGQGFETLISPHKKEEIPTGFPLFSFHTLSHTRQSNRRQSKKPLLAMQWLFIVFEVICFSAITSLRDAP